MSALPASSTVGVVGAGAMGAGIAQVAAQAGHRVLLFDTRVGAADAARQSIGKALAAQVSKGRLAADVADAIARRIESVHTIGDFASARLVVEAIVEDLDAKRDLYHQLEVVASPDAILASNTSSISITALAAGLRYPGRIVGMHFFNPAPVMALVEVVSGLATDPAVAERVHATAAAWGKSPVHAASTPGFIVNRCARPFYAEALRLLAERAADPATIDAVMREAGGFRMGPFELMDLIGHDVNFAVTESVWKAYFHDARFTPSVLQRELVAAGFLGRKSGRGFYPYGEAAMKPLPQTEAARPVPRRVVVHGALGPAEPLVTRWRKSGVAIERAEPLRAFAGGAVAADGALLALTEGGTATARAVESDVRDLVALDLALDYESATRLAVARADTCSDAGYDGVVGLLQAAGIAVSRLDDVAGLTVARTVAMLANEAADAVVQGIAAPGDIDMAMQKGVSYPIGPLAWCDRVGAGYVALVLRHLAAHYGEDRYRLSPLLARRRATGGPIHA